MYKQLKHSCALTLTVVLYIISIFSEPTPLLKSLSFWSRGLSDTHAYTKCDHIINYEPLKALDPDGQSFEIYLIRVHIFLEWHIKVYIYKENHFLAIKQPYLSKIFHKIIYSIYLHKLLKI